MTADLTPRETVARALGESGAFGCGCCAWAEDRDLDADAPRAATLARAALTAIADHPGLAEVLRGHIPCTWTGVTTPDGLPMMTCGRGLPAGPDRLSAHLADVVREWLRGAS